METPLKFRAPGMTRALGLGVGRLVFRALNGAEIVLATALAITHSLTVGSSRNGERPARAADTEQAAPSLSTVGKAWCVDRRRRTTSAYVITSTPWDTSRSSKRRAPGDID